MQYSFWLSPSTSPEEQRLVTGDSTHRRRNESTVSQDLYSQTKGAEFFHTPMLNGSSISPTIPSFVNIYVNIFRRGDTTAWLGFWSSLGRLGFWPTIHNISACHKCPLAKCTLRDASIVKRHLLRDPRFFSNTYKCSGEKRQQAETKNCCISNFQPVLYPVMIERMAAGHAFDSSGRRLPHFASESRFMRGGKPR